MLIKIKGNNTELVFASEDYIAHAYEEDNERITVERKFGERGTSSLYCEIRKTTGLWGVLKITQAIVTSQYKYGDFMAVIDLKNEKSYIETIRQLEEE